jgi:hypothetical protein
MTVLTEKVSWGSLPPEAQSTITTLGELIAEGYSLAEMARAVHKHESWVRDRIDELRDAMLSQAGELEEQLRERAEQLRHRSAPTRAD